jgi:DNA processing protein
MGHDMSAAMRMAELDADDPRYPASLHDLAEPPTTLYCIGDIDLLVPGLAVVGARRATPYGLGCTRRFAGWAARAGVSVVSGAATGCDQAAHSAAIDAGGRTIAVLGCGADIDYPATARQLLALMRERHLVVSEVPWGGLPTRFAFPRRNRIIAGLSAAVLVVEAGLPSGTFSTADAALDLGRGVFAVPGSINSPESRGSNRLIRQGAALVTDVSEFAAELASAGLLLQQPQAASPAEAASAGAIELMLAADPMRADDVARALDLDIVTTSRRLGTLELQGRIVRYRDGRYGVPITA